MRALNKLWPVRKGERRKIFLLWTNLFLIVGALYVLKPLKGALFLSSFGAQALPYVWLVTAVVVGVFFLSMAGFWIGFPGLWSSV